MAKTPGLLFLFLAWHCWARDVAPGVPDLSRRVTWTAPAGTGFWQLFQFAITYHVPIGLVPQFTLKDDGLRTPKSAHSYTETEVSKIVSATLTDSNYVWHLENGVLEVRPAARMSQLEARVLEERLESFRTIDATIQGLGNILQDQIVSILHPGTGYMGILPSSSNSEIVPAFELRDISVQGAANQIVSKGSKGIWILHQTDADPLQEIQVRTLGYKDDARFFDSKTCIIDVLH